MSEQKITISMKDAAIKLAAIILLITGCIQFFVGIRFFSMIDTGESTLLSYIMIFIGGVFLIIISIMEIAYETIEIKLKPINYTIMCLVELVIWYFIPPNNTTAEYAVQVGNTIGMFGIFLLFVALKPNFGPTANKKIYQAVAGIFAFVISCIFLGLGIYVSGILDIADFAGRGTYPGDFYYAFIEVIPENAGITTYQEIRTSGTLMILTSVVIMLIIMLRNRMTLKLASIFLLLCIGWATYDVIAFYLSWNKLDSLFYNTPSLAPDYYTTLKLRDPGVVTVGTVLIILYVVCLLMMAYASMAAKPILEWRRKRDSSIAAAEVFFREGKLQSAIKYLERAAQLSSKIDEEDKAVELLVRIKQIRDKAIKMKKAEAAEKARKAYEKQQKMAKAEAAKGRREKKITKSKVKPGKPPKP
ncbi:MAG: hypothetical protein ACTSRZ_19875 [Promethearchaeota archaeon]